MRCESIAARARRFVLDVNLGEDLMRRLLLASAVALVLIVWSGVGTAAAEEGHHAPVFAPRSSPFGESYRQWATEWLQRVAGTPTPTNPFLHPDNCGPGPNPHAWFLAGALDGAETANCTVPEHKGLLISPLGNFCSGATNNVFTFRKLRDCAFVGLDQVTAVRLRIDGRSVRHPNRFFIVSRKFRFDIPSDNIFGVPGQTTPAVVIGDFIMIRPLTEGRHTIVAYAAGPFPQGFAKITYHIHVVEAAGNKR